jgi:hypothetical protein
MRPGTRDVGGAGAARRARRGRRGTRVGAHHHAQLPVAGLDGVERQREPADLGVVALELVHAALQRVRPRGGAHDRGPEPEHREHRRHEQTEGAEQGLHGPERQAQRARRGRVVVAVHDEGDGAAGAAHHGNDALSR